MTRQTLLATTALLVAITAPLTAQAPTPKPLTAADSTHLMELGHTYARWLLQGRADSLVTMMTPELLTSSGGAAGVAERLSMVGERGGTEVKLITEKLTRRNGLPQFWHEGEFSAYDEEPLVFRFVLELDGKISGIGMGPRSQAPFDH